MSTEPLHIEEVSGSREGIRVFRLAGPLVLANLSSFQSKLRADLSQALILDFAAELLDHLGGVPPERVFLDPWPGTATEAEIAVAPMPASTAWKPKRLLLSERGILNAKKKGGLPAASVEFCGVV